MKHKQIKQISRCRAVGIQFLEKLEVLKNIWSLVFSCLVNSAFVGDVMRVAW
jgi:hypothetical protein